MKITQEQLEVAKREMLIEKRAGLEEQMKTSVIIPVYNQIGLVIKCVSDLLFTTSPMEIILVNDGSTEPVHLLRKCFPDVKIINQDNMGFAGAVNTGISKATGDYICLLNSDIRLPDSHWLRKMLDYMNDYDMVAPAGGRMDDNWNYLPGEAKSNLEEWSYLPAWCLLMSRKVIDTIGGFDTDFGHGFWEDTLFSVKAKRAGLKIGITEGVNVEHIGHQTFKGAGFDLEEQYNKNRQIFLEKLAGLDE